MNQTLTNLLRSTVLFSVMASIFGWALWLYMFILMWPDGAIYITATKYHEYHLELFLAIPIFILVGMAALFYLINEARGKP